MELACNPDQGAPGARPKVNWDRSGLSPLRPYSFREDQPTTSVGLSATGRDRLKKLGDVAITASWISAN